MKNRIPLLENQGKNIVFKGKTLELPLKKNLINKIKKERYDLAWENQELPKDWGLFLEIIGQKYLLAVNAPMATPWQYKIKRKRQDEKKKELRKVITKSEWEKTQMPKYEKRMAELIEKYRQQWKMAWIKNIQTQEEDQEKKKSRRQEWKTITQSLKKRENGEWKIKNWEQLFSEKLKIRLEKEYSKQWRPQRNAIRINIKGRLFGVNMAKQFVLNSGSLKRQSFNQLDYKQKDIRTPWGSLGLRVYIN